MIDTLSKQTFQSVYQLDPFGNTFTVPIQMGPPADPGLIADIPTAGQPYGLSLPPVQQYYCRAGDDEVRIEIHRGYDGAVTRVRIYANQEGPKAQWEGPPPCEGGIFARSLSVHLPDVSTPPDDAGA